MKWDKEIDLSQLYTAYENDQDFKKYQKAVIAVLKENKIEEVYVQQLKDVEDDLDEWDEAFSDLYDYCDENKIWVRVI